MALTKIQSEGTDFDGNIGIGTTSPSAPLHVKGGYPTVHIQRDHATYYSRLLLDNTGSDGIAIDGLGDGVGGVRFSTVTDGTAAEKVRIDSSGRVAIGNTTPQSFTGNASDNLVVGSGSGGEGITIYSATDNQGALSFADGTSGDAAYRGAVSYNHTADRMDFRVGGTIVDVHIKGGKVLAGTENSREVFGSESKIQVESTTAEGISITRTSDDSGAIYLNLGKTRDGSVCQAGDTIGAISWNPDDGTDLNHPSAEILTVVGTGIGSNDVPGDLVFKTNGGTSTTTERMRINKDGNVGIGNVDPGDLSSANHRALQIHSTTNSYLTLTNGTTGSTQASDGFSLCQTGNDTYYINRETTGSHYFSANGSERLAIKDDGKVGIGTTAPGYKLSVLTTGTTDTSLHLATTGGASSNGDATNSIRFTGGTNTRWANAKYEAYDHIFAGNGVEQMRITSGGKVRFNMEDFSADPSDSNYGLQLLNTSGGAIISAGSGTGTESHVIFYNTNGLIGQITTNGSATTYATSSDYRLKENITAIPSSIDRLKQLKPSRFNFKSDKDTTLDGFIAHEVSSVVPEAVTGEKDAVEPEDNEDKGVKKGDPIYQGIDQSKLVPLLTAALQEAMAKIETLETKVAALEAA